MRVQFETKLLGRFPVLVDASIGKPDADSGFFERCVDSLRVTDTGGGKLHRLLAAIARDLDADLVEEALEAAE